MRNSISFYLGLFFLLIVSLSSCKKTNQEDGQGNLQVNFSLNSLKSIQIDTSLATTLSEIVVTIEDINGKVVKSEQHIELYNMNGNYISKPIALPTGKYKLTGFLVLDFKNNVVYASPVKGSSKAYLVQNPLPLEFNISKDDVTKVAPEVINAASCNPEDFGYSTFTLNIAENFDFMVGVFIYDDSIKNYKLTSSVISIISDTTDVYNSSLSPNTNNALVSIYDSVGITNRITLPERFNTFTLVISKTGYKTYTKQFSKEALKLYFRSVDKGPLIVILDPDAVSGLIAYYKFNGDLKDYSGFGNNGTYFGRGVYSSGYKNESNGALDLNGSSDYVVFQNTTQLNPNKISICAWYQGASFYGNGSNSLVTKRNNTGSNIEYQYHLNITSDSYGGNTTDVHLRQFGFGIATDQGLFPLTTTGGTGDFFYKYYQYQLNEWNFIVGTFDGDSMKLYVNGDLKAWRSAKGNLTSTDNDLRIGNTEGLSRPKYDYTAGKIDEVRIYNRALTESEILYLYQH
jgi:Sialidase, N-terminal domain.